MWAAAVSDDSLYDRIGGETVVRPAVALLYQRVLDDPELCDYFKGVDIPRLRAHQRGFLTTVLGGPGLFAGRPLEVAHHGLAITDSSFDAMVDHLLAALRDLGVQERLAAEVAGELELLRPRVVSCCGEWRGWG